MTEQQQQQQLQQPHQQHRLSLRWLRRYKPFFLLGILIISVQIFLAYKSLDIGAADIFLKSHNNDHNNNNGDDYAAAALPPEPSALHAKAGSTVVDEEEAANKLRNAQAKHAKPSSNLTAAHLGFTPACEISAKEAISALQRAKTKDCRQHIAHVACAIQAGHFYAAQLPASCPAGNHSANVPLGCYRDQKEQRLLGGYFQNFKRDNSPRRCSQLCLQSGYPYAGVQYGTECFCGADVPPSAAQLADSSCNMKCSGDAKEICGGFFSMNIYETGIAKFNAKIAESSVSSEVENAVRIAFLLTLNGHALRQVHRLIRALYAPNHFFYIHVDARQDYLYRKLLELEPTFPNIRLARRRFSTIWGGASLLSMLLQSMQDLLASNWQWDYVINLSESDFPVKTLDKLENFLTANRGRNFVKSHGRETQRFIQKQGLDKTFVECDTHMWRIGDRRLPAGIQVDGGSDWVALSRDFVEFVTSQAATHALLKGLLVIFRHTLLPAESFFHTVLRNTHYCSSYVDNNLHVTNWKRKQGCKCQYKHVVDWCGCSPNDFKPDDWTRLQGTESKQIYFARKFEPIINQAILHRLEEWLYGPYTSEYVNLHGYWQSFYEHENAQLDDLTRTIGESVMRLIGRQLQDVLPAELLEMTHYLQRDEYKGFLLRFSGHKADVERTPIMLESRVRPAQYGRLAKNSRFAKRLRSFEISSDYDQKEQVARNFAKLLGPQTELVLSFTYVGMPKEESSGAASHSYNLTLLWIDPLGRLQDFNELHIEESQSNVVHYSKTLLKRPLTPGIWTAKLIGRSAIFAQIRFLVVPLAYHKAQPLSAAEALRLNGGLGLSLPTEFSLPAEWQAHFLTAVEVERLQALAVANAKRTGDALAAWIDELVSKFFLIRETCGVNQAATQLTTAALNTLPLCADTAWSSLAPDPKSDVYALLKGS